MPRWVSQVKLIVAIMRRLNGSLPHDCPACGYHGTFGASGMPPRFDVKCPRCNSLERHRLFVLTDRSIGLVRENAELLHVAPEVTVGKYLRSKCRRYVTLDLSMEGADVKEPLEQTSLPDASFDHVVCAHVLEHVDDRRALKELHRILRPGGTALLMVPIIEGWDCTYENPYVTSPSEREIHFGKDDHVRWYGRDFRQRVTDAGFQLSEITTDTASFVQYALLKGEKIFVARKP
jgi:SAM-dependent methyltransferase